MFICNNELLCMCRSEIIIFFGSILILLLSIQILVLIVRNYVAKILVLVIFLIKITKTQNFYFYVVLP